MAAGLLPVGRRRRCPGPKSGARMIKLDVRQTQVAPPVESTGLVRAATRASSFQVLVAGTSVFVLTAEIDFAALLEKDLMLLQRLGAGTPFPANGRPVFITGTATFDPGRVLYQCVAVPVAG
jgi:hypothetical protein